MSQYIIDRGNRRTQRKNCPSATLSTTNPTWIDPGTNPGLRCERPSTNDLSHGSALSELLASTYKATASQTTKQSRDPQDIMYKTIVLSPNILVQWLILLRIREVPGTNLGPETGHPDWRFLSPSRQMLGSSSPSFSFSCSSQLEHRAPFGVSVIAHTVRRTVRLLGRVIIPSQRPLLAQVNTTHKHKTQISMPRAGFEPAIPATKRPQTYA
jgi:hypothetical protein